MGLHSLRNTICSRNIVRAVITNYKAVRGFDRFSKKRARARKECFPIQFAQLGYARRPLKRKLEFCDMRKETPVQSSRFGEARLGNIRSIRRITREGRTSQPGLKGWPCWRCGNAGRHCSKYSKGQRRSASPPVVSSHVKDRCC